MLALGGTATGIILLGDSWLQLLMAGALGVIFTQFAFLGHEASHRQILDSGPANDRVGRLLATVFVGISYSWWMNKHTRHHANPNQVGKDPDIEPDTVSFLEERGDADRRAGLDHPAPGLPVLPAAPARGHQPAPEVRPDLFGRGRSKVEGRWFELSMIGLRFAVYLGLVFWLLPFGMAARLRRRPARGLRPVHGRHLRPEPQGHADRAGRGQAGLLEQAGADVAQHLAAAGGRPS